MMEDLVSIIMPSYNSEKYISESIDSVIKQTYKNWELLIVDDLSTDNTYKIAKRYQLSDSRIKVFQLENKGGASVARNYAIKNAKGKYIAFLDSDDLWKSKKLAKQIKFMKANNYAFSYTNYYSLKGKEKKEIYSPKRITFKMMLKRNWIGCLTVMYDAEKCGTVQILPLEKRNDYALWLTVLKTVKEGYLLDEFTAYYRLNNGISNGNKFKLIKYHYALFHDILNLSHVKAFFYTFQNIMNYLINKK